MQTLLNPHTVENLVLDFNDDPQLNTMGLMVNMREINAVSLVQINNQLKEFSDRIKTKTMECVQTEQDQVKKVNSNFGDPVRINVHNDKKQATEEELLLKEIAEMEAHIYN